jgi:glycosyltransferase involved in cell wall biosynthesis
MSIMEVLSLGIPVMATNVGGNGEIVTDKVGKLLPADPRPEEIAARLTAYYRLSAEEKNAIRENAHAQIVSEWDVEKLSNEAALYLGS